MSPMLRLVVASTLVILQTVTANLGVLEVTDTSTTLYPCVLYNPLYHDIPEYSESELAPIYVLLDHSFRVGCDFTVDAQIAGKAVAIKRGNCSFVQKADVIVQNNGTVTLIVSQKPINVPGANTTSDYDNINITVAMIGADSFSHIQKLRQPRYVKLYKPPTFDPSAIVLLFIAVVTILVGSLWSGSDVKIRRGDSPVEDADDETFNDNKKREKMPQFTLPMLGCIVLFITAFILLLYFLYDYLVYAVIALFCILGSTALFNCILPFWSRLPHLYRFTIAKIEIELRDSVLLAACLAVGIFWAVQRNESYAWILQDLMGVAFCLYALKRIQIDNFLRCTILLSCLFVYDVFFVFITPYITTNGKSIMVEVATGGTGSSREKIPLLMSIPKILYCHSSPSMLGFGDIVIPGLTVAYCYRFDRMMASKSLRPIYFMTSLTAYTLGLIVTGVALYVMQKGQPALLYIVPFVLVVTMVTAACRHQFRQLWSGDACMQRSSQAGSQNETNSNVAIQNDSDCSDTDETDRLIGQGEQNE